MQMPMTWVPLPKWQGLGLYWDSIGVTFRDNGKENGNYYRV